MPEGRLNIDQKEVEKSLVDTDDTDGLGQSVSNLLDALGDEEQHKILTELDMDEIRHLAVMGTIADDTMDDFIKEYTTLKISHKRRSRKEFVKVAETIGGLVSSNGEGRMQAVKKRLGLG